MAIFNPFGRGPIALICEHASNHIPDSHSRLGLSEADLHRHIAWDIGALGLAQQLASALDAPLAYATQSRLMLDLNRSVDASDSITTHSEGTPIPGNLDLSRDERLRRQQRIYLPFHNAVDALIDRRLADGTPTAVVSIHSFTPNYDGVARPWHVGVISHEDRWLADLLLSALAADPALCVGDNQPYGPGDGVYHSLQLHGQARGLRCAMIEVRNDLIVDEDGQRHWAERLRRILDTALEN